MQYTLFLTAKKYGPRLGGEHSGRVVPGVGGERQESGGLVLKNVETGFGRCRGSDAPGIDRYKVLQIPVPFTMLQHVVRPDHFVQASEVKHPVEHPAGRPV